MASGGGVGPVHASGACHRTVTVRSGAAWAATCPGGGGASDTRTELTSRRSDSVPGSPGSAGPGGSVLAKAAMSYMPLQPGSMRNVNDAVSRSELVVVGVVDGGVVGVSGVVSGVGGAVVGGAPPSPSPTSSL